MPYQAFPMYVGMNQFCSNRNYREVSVPHVRGDEPAMQRKHRVATERSPCTWG
jgi:hypothetical protein